MPRLGRYSWLVLASGVLLAMSTVGGCSDQPVAQVAVPETPDAGNDALDELGDPAPSIAMAFGRACEEDEDCGLELDCIQATSLKLVRGGPPSGLCTASCADDPKICATFADDAHCVEFGADAFCVEGCDYGTAEPMAFDREKCHGRREFACRPVLVNVGGRCQEDDDCDEDEVCDGTCQLVTTACMPQCNGDFDCEAGRFCDPKTGECIDDVPSGSRLGASCQGVDDASCRGVCTQIGADSEWRCAEPCTLGVYPSCGSATDPAEVGCAVAAGPEASFGDLGWCAKLCDCNADCQVGRQCITSERAYLRRPGYCGVPGPDSRVRPTCREGGSGGSGGRSGSGGTGGEAGSPASAGQAGEGFL